MGFFVMLGSAVLGVVLLVIGARQSSKDRRWLVSILLGALLIAFAVWLGWPK